MAPGINFMEHCKEVFRKQDEGQEIKPPKLKHIFQIMIKSITSNFYHLGPFYFSENGLSAIEIYEITCFKRNI